jgi:signal peptidase II
MRGFVLSANHPKRKNALVPKSAKSLLWPVVIVLSVLLADQISKILALRYLAETESVAVLGRFLKFTLVYNEGGAMGTNLGSSTYYLIASILILLFVMYYIYLARRDRTLAFTLSFVAGGALGNIIDRIRLGKVIDFIDVDIPDVSLFGRELERWWTFNIADSAITCAIVVLLVRVLFVRHPKEVQSPETSPPQS